MTSHQAFGQQTVGRRDEHIVAEESSGDASVDQRVQSAKIPQGGVEFKTAHRNKRITCTRGITVVVWSNLTNELSGDRLYQALDIDAPLYGALQQL